MTIEQLQSLHRARPFKPFTLHLADGRALTVRHPEVLSHAGGRTALLTNPDDSFEIIDLLMVTTLSAPTKRRRKAS